MSTPFLVSFAQAILAELLHRGAIEIEPDTQDAVVAHVAARLHSVHRGSLISNLSAALVSCEQVVELWIDDEELKDAVDDLGL